MIPSIKRKEWRELLLREDTPNLTSHSFRLKINTTKRKIRSGLISREQGIRELYNECRKNYDLYRSDLHRIFDI
jgi:hypothetical protein